MLKCVTSFSAVVFKLIFKFLLPNCKLHWLSKFTSKQTVHVNLHVTIITNYWNKQQFLETPWINVGRLNNARWNNFSNKARHGLRTRRLSCALNKSRNDLMILSFVVKTPCYKEIFLEINNEWPKEKWNFKDGNLCSVNQSSRLSWTLLIIYMLNVITN